MGSNNEFQEFKAAFKSLLTTSSSSNQVKSTTQQGAQNPLQNQQNPSNPQPNPSNPQPIPVLSSSRKRKLPTPSYDSAKVVPMIFELKTKLAKLEEELYRKSGGEMKQKLEYILARMASPDLVQATDALEALTEILEDDNTLYSYERFLVDKVDRLVLLVSKQFRFYFSHYHQNPKHRCSRSELQNFLDLNTEILVLMIKDCPIKLGLKMTRESMHELMLSLMPFLVWATHREYQENFDAVDFDRIYDMVSSTMLSTNSEEKKKKKPKSRPSDSSSSDSTDSSNDDQESDSVDSVVHLDRPQFWSVLLRLLRDFTADSMKKSESGPDKFVDSAVDVLVTLLRIFFGLDPDQGKFFQPELDSCKLEPVIYEIYSIFELYSKINQFSFDINMQTLEFAKSFIQMLFTDSKAGWRHFSLVDSEIAISNRNPRQVALIQYLQSRGFFRTDDYVYDYAITTGKDTMSVGAAQKAVPSRLQFPPRPNKNPELRKDQNPVPEPHNRVPKLQNPVPEPQNPVPEPQNPVPERSNPPPPPQPSPMQQPSSLHKLANCRIIASNGQIITIHPSSAQFRGGSITESSNTESNPKIITPEQLDKSMQLAWESRKQANLRNYFSAPNQFQVKKAKESTSKSTESSGSSSSSMDSSEDLATPLKVPTDFEQEMRQKLSALKKTVVNSSTESKTPTTTIEKVPESELQQPTEQTKIQNRNPESNQTPKKKTLTGKQRSFMISSELNLSDESSLSEFSLDSSSSLSSSDSSDSSSSSSDSSDDDSDIMIIDNPKESSGHDDVVFLDPKNYPKKDTTTSSKVQEKLVPKNPVLETPNSVLETPKSVPELPKQVPESPKLMIPRVVVLQNPPLASNPVPEATSKQSSESGKVPEILTLTNAPGFKGTSAEILEYIGAIGQATLLSNPTRPFLGSSKNLHDFLTFKTFQAQTLMNPLAVPQLNPEISKQNKFPNPKVDMLAAYNRSTVDLAFDRMASILDSETRKLVPEASKPVPETSRQYPKLSDTVARMMNAYKNTVNGVLDSVTTNPVLETQKLVPKPVPETQKPVPEAPIQQCVPRKEIFDAYRQAREAYKQKALDASKKVPEPVVEHVPETLKKSTEAPKQVPETAAKSVQEGRPEVEILDVPDEENAISIVREVPKVVPTAPSKSTPTVATPKVASTVEAPKETPSVLPKEAPTAPKETQSAPPKEAPPKETPTTTPPSIESPTSANPTNLPALDISKANKQEIFQQVQQMHLDLLKSQAKINDLLQKMAQKK